MSDESGYIQFLAEARSGDRAGLGRLAVLVHERLYPFVLGVTHSRDATEDILQETLLTMLGRLDSLRDNGRFWSWIYRIAWNKVRDRRRSRRLESIRGAALLRRYDPGDEESGGDDPLAAQIHTETLQQLSDALAGLSGGYRDILRLRCYEDLPYAEIAARTRTSPDKVRIRFHRAKRSLKARLAACP